MAMWLRENRRRDYKSMNDGEQIERERIKSNTRKVLPELYEVEKIVAVKECPKEVSLYILRF